MSTRTRILSWALLALAVLSVAGVGTWRYSVCKRSYYTDADRIRVPMAEAPIRRILWQPALPVPGATDADTYEPRVSPDGNLLVFVRGRAGSNADLFQRRRTASGWSEPEAIPGINSSADELGPELAPDGSALYFYSDRDGGEGGYDLWVSRAEPAGWTTPVNLGAGVNSSYNEYGPALTPDGKRLYFSSNRPRPGEPAAQRDNWPATIREQRTRHDYDLFRFDLDQASPAAALTELNTLADEGAPAMSPAGDFLYFASDREGGLGGFDIYRSRILRGDLLAPEQLGAAVNSASNDLDPALSTDGFRIFFSSDRSEQAEAKDARYSLWVSGSREVFTEVEPARAGMFAELWRSIWPWLLALLTALLLALLLFYTMRDQALRRRLAQLSLMAKCLLVSFLIHALLLSLLAAWRVGNAIGDILHAPGGTKVVLGSVGSGGGLASQVRAAVATVAIQTPTLETQRPGINAEVTPAPIARLSVQPAPVQVTALAPTIAPDDARAQSATLPETSAPLPSAPETLSARSPQPESPDAPTVEPSPTIAGSLPEPRRAILATNDIGTPTAVQTTPESSPVDLAGAAAVMAEPEEAPAATSSIRVSTSTPSSAPLNEARLPPASAALAPTTESSMAPGSGAATSVASRAAMGLQPAVAGSTVSLNPASAVPTDAGPASGIAASESTPRGTVASSRPSLGLGAAPAARMPDSSAQAATPAGEASTAPGSGAATSVASRAPLAAQPAVGGGTVTLTPAPAAIGTAAPASGVAATESAAPTSSVAVSRPASRIGIGSAPAARLPETPSQAGMAGSEPAGAQGIASPLPGRSRAPAVAARGEPGASPSIHLAPGATVGESAAPGVAITPGDAPAQGTGPSPTVRPGLALAPSASVGVRLPDVPTAPQPPVESFAQRAPEVRGEVLERMGGSQETEQAVGLALEWFTHHQEADGHWSGKRFDDRCGNCAGAAQIDFDAATTGMTLLCFLSAGHTHQKDGPYRERVDKALRWLAGRVDGSGDLRGRETMYSQTIGAVALCEAFAMTRDPNLEGPARRAVNFVLRGDGSRQNSRDTSVLGWQIMAVKSAERCGFNVSKASFESAGRWLDRCAPRESPGRYGYAPGDRPGAAASAEAMFVRQLLGHSREEPRMRETAAFILETPPQWRKGAPTYYWYYATLALFQQQGDEWKRWNEGVVRELLANQRREGAPAGSWDPTDEWSQLGGRIYQTAVCTLSLEVYYRYAPAR